MKFALYYITFLLFATSAFAGGVFEDKETKFVYRDSILDFSSEACPEGGIRLTPENSFYVDDSDLPYRVYRVALPDSIPPSVAIRDTKTKTMTSIWCQKDSIPSLKTIVSKPFLRDGLWMIDISVPLLKSKASFYTVREQFEISVEFRSKKAKGYFPGKRALAKVLNSKSASKWGVSRNHNALRRAAVSELSNVEWIARFSIGNQEVASLSEDGLYAVPFTLIRSALSAAGLEDKMSGVPVSKWRLYGASADTLQEEITSTSDILPAQLFQIPIEIRDHNGRDLSPNGIFDDGDTLVFVGYGTSLWKKDSLFPKAPYYFSVSPYSFYQYFQLGWSDQGSPKRLENLSTSTYSNPKDIAWKRYVRAEKEALLRDTYFGKELFWETSTGKEWFWFWHSFKDTLSLSSSDLYFPSTSTLKGIKEGGQGVVSFSFLPHRSTAIYKVGDLSQSTNSTYSALPYKDRMSKINFTASVNGASLIEHDTLMNGGNFVFSVSNLKANGNEYTVTMLPNTGLFDRFDGYSIAYDWNTQVDSAEWFLPGMVSGVIRIPVSDESLRVLKFKNGEPLGLLRVQNGYAIDSLSLSDDIRYLVYRNNYFKSDLKIEATPERMNGVLTRLENISSKTEYLIITSEAFQKPGLELAEFRSSGEIIKSIPTTIVLTEDIYKVYNGGSLDPIAIRNYIAYARSVCPNLKYVLLGGTGHYDYRKINTKLPQIYVPPFEREDMATDDFFAALDIGEVVVYGNYDIDLSVGRLPVSSEMAFYSYIEKVKEYEQVGIFDNGRWRNNIILAADDALNGASVDHTPHTESQEKLVATIDSLAKHNKTRVDYSKIYLLDYVPDALNQKPEAATDLINSINQGALFTIYFGHGSITDWAGEGLLKPSYIDRVSNQGRYTILGSFSCTVGRFDKGDEMSLSEVFLGAASKGAIASIGATRETFASNNENLARGIILNSFFHEDQTLGNAFWAAKGRHLMSFTRQRNNNERYVLLGEPVLSIPSSKLNVKLDQPLDTIQALDKITLSGTVSEMSSGKIYLDVREGSYIKKISNGIPNTDGIPKYLDISYSGRPIYSETVNVKQGQFSTEFITPRKIAFGDSNAQVYAWAYSNDNPYVGTMLVDSIMISGTSSYADSINDQSPPEIKIQSCLTTSSFSSIAEGDRIRLQSPGCLQVVIEDSTAIDFREEADEGISFEVVGKTAPFHPWPYLEQTSKKVMLRMTFAESSYPPGVYEFKVSAYDILGNRAEKSVFVELTETLQKGLMDVFNVPNPMGKKGTTFYFKDLAIDRSAVVSIYIYNQNGRLVQVLKNAKSGETFWDGRDFYGRLLANGLYHYIVKSDVPASEMAKKQVFSVKQKLVISR